MKLIEGMKLIKELQVKADGLRAKIAQHSAHLSFESPVYPDQKAQVGSWLQAHEDITREVASLFVRVSKTNLATQVTMAVGGNTLTKSVTEWIVRRRLLAGLDHKAWCAITDRNLKETLITPTGGSVATAVKIVRYYEPTARDAKIAAYHEEPNIINRTLETVNAVTDLLD